ncbi:MAG TPA: acyl carrier protein [Cyclobacteriaceae bacterium]|jgi:acyl carrier protein|nr:acyl carrier protein [Cyclobacteriaceae bacterium]
MTTEDISQELCAFIRKSIVDNKIEVEPDTLFNQIGIDSLSTIELVLFIERKFKVALPEQELIPENFKSARALANCTKRYLHD